MRLPEEERGKSDKFQTLAALTCADLIEVHNYQYYRDHIPNEILQKATIERFDKKVKRRIRSGYNDRPSQLSEQPLDYLALRREFLVDFANEISNEMV